MSEKTFGILVVGAGWVSTQHIAAYKKNRATKIVAICDRSLDVAQRRTEEQGLSDVALFDDLDAALRHPGIDAVRWFASSKEFEAATPVEVFAASGGRRKGSRHEYNPLSNVWIDDGLPMEYDGLEMALVKFDNGVLGKVSVNTECIMPYRFPLRIFGDLGTVFDNRIWSHKYPGKTDWIELPMILPDSSDVSHHPFQGEIDHFVECVQHNYPSHCSLDDAVKTHEIAFAAKKSAQTNQPVRLPPVGRLNGTEIKTGQAHILGQTGKMAASTFLYPVMALKQPLVVGRDILFYQTEHGHGKSALESVERNRRPNQPMEPLSFHLPRTRWVVGKARTFLRACHPLSNLFFRGP